jgi:xylulose-5-phosphate/fructose-6-phosphate phosphoketolase
MSALVKERHVPVKRNHHTPSSHAKDHAPKEELLRRMDAYWRAANYLSVGQIYLFDNPLLTIGLVANVYLEGTYSEVYPDVSQDEEGMKKLFKQFSFPDGIPSHVAPK